MIANGNLEIQEQEYGTYIFPGNGSYTWALWIDKNGRAELYTKRNPETGALLGKPIILPGMHIGGAAACPETNAVYVVRYRKDGIYHIPEHVGDTIKIVK